MEMNRRQFLTYLGTGTAALASLATGIPAFAAERGLSGKTADHLFGLDENKHKPVKVKFKPIQATNKDELVLPQGYKYDVVALYGDKINAKGDTFGFNADFTCFLPIDGSSEHGLLWVNHEYLGELEYYVTGYDTLHADSKNNTRTAAQIEKYLYSLGGSVIEVKKQNGKWGLIPDSKYGRRVSGLTKHSLTGPAAGSAAVGGTHEVTGTFANCSGGATLWNTILSCEENFDSVVADTKLKDETHYGWVVEVDPFEPSSVPKKHTALGRFSHENTAMTLAPNGQLVIYMGDDANDQYVYKYVSKGSYSKSAGKANARLLEEGTLYVANFSKGKWIALDYGRNEALQKAVDSAGKSLFTSQADVLVKCREAAKAAGATPMDRPEDLEVHPIDGSVFISLTNNSKHGNFYGQIVRLFPKDNNHAAEEFTFEIFAAGGPQSGFAAPDNLAFDSAGNLWVVTDISSSSMNSGIYKTFGNNGVFLIPTSGEGKGVAVQFASAPVGAEMTGPWFTPDEKTLFLSVQHPGENLESYATPTSHWPKGGTSIALPGVVAITGF
ncbi:PhoX family protein [Aneurinibacillus aneurinilyticus]|jgi:secreted PhoX family phosphatase|uniref:PhoX family protein n=1 Tax=Aneurinibacillus aneurinilyticus TaxID=1391 RepID=UPI0023F74539|nr:PhoX family phosphatase [Aneurinibacillus aneurinilyticus]MCI1696350.1 PhoX family phosphatase [Aneurinibacillus aneurinilyticus]